MQERQLQRPIPQTLFLFTDATQPVEINKHHRKSPLGMDGLTPPPLLESESENPQLKSHSISLTLLANFTPNHPPAKGCTKGLKRLEKGKPHGVQLRQSNLSSKLHSHKEETAVALATQVGGAVWVENGWVGGAIRPECQKTMGKSIYFFLVGCQIRGVYRAISFFTHLLLQFAFVIILDKNMSTVILRKVQKRRSSHFRRKAV